MAGENRTGSFLALNPRGQVPVLVDGEVTVWDSQAILVYLARRYGEAWLPADPAPMAEVMQWLAVLGERTAVRPRAGPRGPALRPRLRPRLVPDIRPRRPEGAGAAPRRKRLARRRQAHHRRPRLHALRRAFPHGRHSPRRSPGGPRVDRPHSRSAGLHRDGGDVSGDRTAEQEGGRSSGVAASRPTRGLDAAVASPRRRSRAGPAASHARSRCRTARGCGVTPPGPAVPRAA